MSTKKLPYALHGSVHIVDGGTKLYVNPSDLVEAYGLTDKDEYVFFDERKHRKGDYIHLKASDDMLAKIFPEDVGEFKFEGNL